MEKIEESLREIVIKGDWGIRREVIRDMVKYWDKHGNGYFPEFISKEFEGFWRARVSKN